MSLLSTKKYGDVVKIFMKNSSPSKRINDLLTELDISQKEFAEKVGLTQSAISGYLTEKRSFDKNFALSLAHVYNVNPDWLMNGAGNMFLKNERPLIREDIKELIPNLEKLSKAEIAKLKKLLETYIE